MRSRIFKNKHLFLIYLNPTLSNVFFNLKLLIIVSHLNIALTDRHSIVWTNVDTVSFMIRCIDIIDEMSFLLYIGCNHFLKIFAHFWRTEHVLSSIPFNVPVEKKRMILVFSLQYYTMYTM